METQLVEQPSLEALPLPISVSQSVDREGFRVVSISDYGFPSLIAELDDKEILAAQKFLDIERKRRERKKGIKLQKKYRRWCFSRSETLDQAKRNIDVELGNARLPRSYEEIKRLLRIENNPVYAKALTEWSRKEALFTSRVERKKSKVADLKNQIYQLIGFFSVFQVVLYAAVSQSNLLHCHNWWSPIILSLAASIVTIVGVVQKLQQVERFQKTIRSEVEVLKEVVNRLYTLREKGVKDFEFAQFEYREGRLQTTRRFKIDYLIVIPALVLVSLAFAVSYWRILCHPDP